jgi:hypothetical protein
MDHYQVLTNRAKAPLPSVQAAFVAGGLDVVCEVLRFAHDFECAIR